jgi:hypothetical protein
MAPFFRKLGVQPRSLRLRPRRLPGGRAAGRRAGRLGALPEPRFLGAPAQPLGQQQFVDAAAPDGDAPLLVQVRLQPVERPARKGQPQLVRLRQRRRQHLPHRLGPVRRRPAGPRAVLKPPQAVAVEAPDPLPPRVRYQPERRRRGRRGLPACYPQNQPRPLDHPRRLRPRARPARQLPPLVRRQLPYPQRHPAVAPPVAAPLWKVAPMELQLTWWMHH